MHRLFSCENKMILGYCALDFFPCNAKQEVNLTLSNSCVACYKQFGFLQFLFIAKFRSNHNSSLKFFIHEVFLISPNASFCNDPCLFNIARKIELKLVIPSNFIENVRVKVPTCYNFWTWFFMFFKNSHR